MPVALEADGRERGLEPKVQGTPALDALDRPAQPEPIVPRATSSLVTPPALEADAFERDPGVSRWRTFELDATAESAALEPIASPAPAPVVVPVALEEDGRERGLEPKVRGAPALDALDRPAQPEPIVPRATSSLVTPPAVEADAFERDPGISPRWAFELDATAEFAAPEPIASPAPAPVVVPVALEEDGRERGLEPKLRGAPALDALDRPAQPEPIVPRATSSLVTPPAVEGESRDREPNLEERVEQTVWIHNVTDRTTQELAVMYANVEFFAASVEEAMRHHIGEAPGPLPCLVAIPRNAEANQLCEAAWRVVLGPELDELRSSKGDRERVEEHIERVCTRAQTDDAWRDRVVSTIAQLVALRCFVDRDTARTTDREPADQETRLAAIERLHRQLAEGGIDAWSEQTVTRAAGLEVDWSFGDLTRSRASGLMAEDALRLALYPIVRDARTLNRAFPRRADERADAVTVSEWHGRLERLVLNLRRRVIEPEVRQVLIDGVVGWMIPDVQLEHVRGGLAREPAKRGPPPLGERDQAQLELTRQRAREAGLDDDFDMPPRRASAAPKPADDTPDVEPPAPPEPQTANIELEHHRRVEELEADRKRKAARARKSYGAEAVDLYVELQRRLDQGERGPRDTPIERTTAIHSRSRATLRFADAHGRVFDTGPRSLGTLARVRALIDGRPPEEIPELEREITREIALELARVRGHER